jgi:hypothetical protein
MNDRDYTHRCKICGGEMYGDGYSTPLHCESVESPDWLEPDANPVYCPKEED